MVQLQLVSKTPQSVIMLSLGKFMWTKMDKTIV